MLSVAVAALVSTIPFTSTLITVAAGSTALAGNLITRPSLPFSVFTADLLASKEEETTLFFKPGITSCPSAGQLNTEKYKVVFFPVCFCVQRPQVNKPKGLAFVS